MFDSFNYSGNSEDSTVTFAAVTSTIQDLYKIPKEQFEQYVPNARNTKALEQEKTVPSNTVAMNQAIEEFIKGDEVNSNITHKGTYAPKVEHESSHSRE